jgi:predicted ATP-dependent endonuclease of OLD family
VEIENYKSHLDTLLSNLGSYHCLIGANSSGKTSILEIAKLIKNTNALLRDPFHIVHGGLENNESKTVEFTFYVELSDEEQRKFYHYLNLPDEEEIRTIMRRLKVTFSMKVTNDPRFGIENRILLTGLEISDTNNESFIPVLAIQDPETMNLEESEFNTDLLNIGRIANNPVVNENLRNASKIGRNPSTYFSSKPTNSLPYDFVQYFFSKLRFVPSHRQSKKAVVSKLIESEIDIKDLDADLIQYMITLHSNKNDRFNIVREICKRIFPEIMDIHPFKINNEESTIAIDKKETKNILLGNEGGGIDQLFMILWQIELSEPGTVWFIDEPEAHLHPGAQKALYDFLVRQTDMGKQIIVGTHSLLFVHKRSQNEISILTNHDNITKVIDLNLLIEAEKVITPQQGILVIRKHVFDALGYDPSYEFEPKNIVIVEGKADGKIIDAFAKTLNMPIDSWRTIFVPLGDKQTVEKYSHILVYILTGKNCTIVIDNDKKNPSQEKDKIMKLEKAYKDKTGEKTVLEKKHFHLYPQNVYSIEHYLLVPEAIYSAANCSDLSKLQEIKNMIDAEQANLKNKTITPKYVLQNLWESLGFGTYHDVNTAEIIAKQISKDHLEKFSEVKELIEKITS